MKQGTDIGDLTVPDQVNKMLYSESESILFVACEKNGIYCIDMSADEQVQKLQSLKEELFNLRFQHATGQLENPMRLREVKKSIAQVKTVQREVELGIRK